MSDEYQDLALELETYRTGLADWKDHEGKFVLIHESEVCGFFGEYAEALTEGYKKFGVVPFLVKKVLRQHQAHSITRLVAPQIVV